jgi:hypothetical protein
VFPYVAVSRRKRVFDLTYSRVALSDSFFVTESITIGCHILFEAVQLHNVGYNYIPPNP